MALVLGAVGCSSPEVTEPEPEDPGQVDEDPEKQLDPDEVLMEAAKDYFAHIAAGNNNITPSADVKAMLEDNPNSVFILDIRSAADFEAGHIPGAYHSALGKVGEIMDHLPRNKPVIVACYSGQTAGVTVAYLKMAGFDNVSSLLSGINLGWVGADFELEETGMQAAADLPAVSSPADDAEAILWERAQEYSKAIDSGQLGFIMTDQQAAFYEEIQGNPNGFYVIDLRKADDFKAGHIEHSVNVPFAQFGDVLEDLPTTVPIVVACYSGQTAAQTQGVLRMLGFDSARNLHFGVRDGWVGKNDLPLVTE